MDVEQDVEQRVQQDGEQDGAALEREAPELPAEDASVRRTCELVMSSWATTTPQLCSAVVPTGTTASMHVDRLES